MVFFKKILYRNDYGPRKQEVFGRNTQEERVVIVIKLNKLKKKAQTKGILK